MKRIPLAMIALPCLLWSAPAARWQWLNPRPTGSNIVHTFAKDSLRGIVVAENGDVAETTDAGATWTTGFGGSGVTNLIAASTLDGGTILGAGGSGSLWKTVDAGRSWRATKSGAVPFYGICQISPTTALAVGGDGTVLRSGNGGDSWEKVNTDPVGRHLIAVSCGPDGLSVAVGTEGYVVKSLDSGRTWEELPSPTGAMLSAVAFRDPATGYAAGEGGLFLETGNGGETWTIRVLDSLGFYRGLRIDGAGMTLVGNDGQMWKAGGAGMDWTRTETGTPVFLAATARFGNASEIAVGNGGLILQSTDNGATWSQRSRGSPKAIIGMEVLSPSSWVAFGIGGLVMRTSDAGESWTEWTAEAEYGFLAGDFHGDNKGLLTGYAGIIMRTEDGGDTWAQAVSGVSGLRLDGVAWADSSTAVAVGEEGSLLRSTDGGKTWNSLSPPGPAGRSLSAIRFLSPAIGIIAGYGGLILKTTDGGATWSERPTPSGNDLYALSFLNASDGMAAGHGDTVLATRDGGETWTALSTGSADDLLYAIAMVGPDTAIVAGQWGHFALARITTDGGKTWSAIPNASNQGINGVVRVGPGRAVALGGGGSILLMDLNSGPASIRPAPVRAPLASAFSAGRGSGSSKVRFGVSLPYSGKASITRYAADGRKAGMLFTGFLPAGTQALEAESPTGRGSGFFRLTLDAAGRRSLSWFCRSED